MLNYKFYKLFNNDLYGLNNNQLLIHWNNIGYKENRINSIESFFKLYPYFNYLEYKQYNNDIDIMINNKIELMKHWHFIGKNNRICSSKYFNYLYPNLNIKELNKDNLNIIDFHNIYHKENKYNNLLNNNLLDNIKTYIINLDERTDRFNDTLLECKKIELNNIERYSAIKINDTNYNLYKLIDESKAWKKNDIKYLYSASGCKLSHLEVLKKGLSVKEDYILVLEDDVVFENNILFYLNLALIQLKDIDWDILFLSSNLLDKNDATKIDNNILKLNKCLTTTAQLFQKKKLEKIIKIIENSDVEIDNTYDLFIENKYCLYPMCTYQRLSFSDINNKITNYGHYHKKYIY
jgi:GR25 family glycosyltransferase involved in LPS biosynthesis